MHVGEAFITIDGMILSQALSDIIIIRYLKLSDIGHSTLSVIFCAIIGF